MKKIERIFCVLSLFCGLVAGCSKKAKTPSYDSIKSFAYVFNGHLFESFGTYEADKPKIYETIKTFVEVKRSYEKIGKSQGFLDSGFYRIEFKDGSLIGFCPCESTYRFNDSNTFGSQAWYNAKGDVEGAKEFYEYSHTLSSSFKIDDGVYHGWEL